MDTIIWDLGGVLVDWKTTYVYDENYFESLETRDYFFEHIFFIYLSKIYIIKVYCAANSLNLK